jgi:cell division protein FtsX
MLTAKTQAPAPLALEWRSRAWAYGAVFGVGLVVAFALSLFLEQRDTVRGHVAREAEDIPWMVFLNAQADRHGLEEAIRSFPGIRSIRFVSRDEALRALQQDDVLSRALTLTGRNPLPDSFEVRWSPFFLRADYLDHTTEKVREMKGVEEAGFDRARVDRLTVLQRWLYQSELALLALLWGVSVVLVLLMGRLLFFPRGALPGVRLLSGVLAGAAGGAGGALLSRGLVATLSWRALLAAAAAGLLLTLIQHSFQEP